MDTRYLDNVLEEAKHPSPVATKVREEWEKKPATEQVSACRKVLFGGISPILHENLEADAVAEIEALFETTLSSIEQFSQQRGRQRVGSQS